MDEKYVRKLEEVIKQMIQPLKNVPFNLVIEVLSGHRVIFFDENNPEHKEVLQVLEEVGEIAGRNIKNTGIKRARPNEVGNDIEEFVKDAFKEKGISAETPTTRSGRKKSTGYPDIVFYYKNKPYYLECKTYNRKNINTTQRTFYLSPSEEFKVVHDTLHFMISFEIYKDTDGLFKTNHFKILSIEDLSLDVKHEFNSDNRRLYSGKDGTKILIDKPI